MKKFVVDANILFSLGKETSFTNQLLKNEQLVLYSSSFAIEELKEHSNEIERKTKISFEEFKKNIIRKVKVINLEEIEKDIKKFLNSLSKLLDDQSVHQTHFDIKLFKNKIRDNKDISYLALAQKLNLPIWSNDGDLKEQYERLVITTEDLIEFLED